ncbi:MAG TPA: ParB/RepB/Spo0J family partition protein [Urbifossiella sp.]|nr:ParB/RepB/Spo0J family partition protein [Urbifossiella sp.]
MNIALIPLDALVPDPTQPRTVMTAAELDALAESLRDRGVQNPIRVQPADAAGRHVIVSGHRRHAALVRLGAASAACVITARLPDEADMLAEQLIDNLLREDLSPIDEAGGYRRYMALRGVTATQAAHDLHVPPARISRVLPLLDLPADLREHIHAGRILKDTAYHLSRLPAGDERTQLLARAASGLLSRDEAARAAKASRPRPTAAEPAPARRVTCPLGGGRSLTVSAAAVQMDTLIQSLEEVLKEARKARAQGWDVATLAKAFRDRAVTGGER